MSGALTTIRGVKSAVPLNALAALAAAAGYEDRGDRASAEFYLGLGMARLDHTLVEPASFTGLLQTIYALARGTQ